MLLNEIPPPELIEYYGLDPDTDCEPDVYFDYAFEYGDYSQDHRLNLLFDKYPGLFEQNPTTKYKRGWKEDVVELIQVKRLFDILNSDEIKEMHELERLIFFTSAGNYDFHNYHFLVEDINQIKTRLLNRLNALQSYEALEYLNQIETTIKEDIYPKPKSASFDFYKDELSYLQTAYDLLGIIMEYQLIYQTKTSDNLSKYSIVQRVMVLKELGILDHLFKHYSPDNNVTRISKILEPILNEDSGTIRRYIDAIYKEQSSSKNHPYKNSKNITEIDNFFKSLKITKIK